MSKREAKRLLKLLFSQKPKVLLVKEKGEKPEKYRVFFRKGRLIIPTPYWLDQAGKVYEERISDSKYLGLIVNPYGQQIERDKNK